MQCHDYHICKLGLSEPFRFKHSRPFLLLLTQSQPGLSCASSMNSICTGKLTFRVSVGETSANVVYTAHKLAQHDCNAGAFRNYKRQQQIVGCLEEKPVGQRTNLFVPDSDVSNGFCCSEPRTTLALAQRLSPRRLRLRCLPRPLRTFDWATSVSVTRLPGAHTNTPTFASDGFIAASPDGPLIWAARLRSR